MFRLLVATLIFFMCPNMAMPQDSELTRADDASDEHVEDESKTVPFDVPFVRVDRMARSQATELIAGDDTRQQWAEIVNGNKLLKVGRFHDARDAIGSALKGLEKSYGKDSPEIAPAIVYLSTANATLGKKRQQNKLLDRALKLIAKHHGRSSTEYADIKLRAGQLLFDSAGDVAGAITQFESAYDIYTELSGSVDAGLASAVLSLGHMYWVEGQIEKGYQYLSQAEDMISELPNIADSRLGLAALSLGTTFLRIEQFEVAQRYFLIALNGLSTAHPEMLHYHVDARAGAVVAYVLAGKFDMASEHCAAIGNWALPEWSDSHPGLPRRVAPIYPLKLIMQGAEGFVDLAFTVDEKGFVRSPKVIHVEGDKDFVPAALTALCKFKYKPRIENGEPVAVENVKFRITFKLE